MVKFIRVWPYILLPAAPVRLSIPTLALALPCLGKSSSVELQLDRDPSLPPKAYDGIIYNFLLISNTPTLTPALTITTCNSGQTT